MRHALPQTDVPLDPSLADYIDQLVAAKVSERVEALQKEAKPPSNRATIVAFSGDMDKLIAAFIIATGAAAMGMDVCMYFTFWALAALKKKTRLKGKPLADKLMALMLPSGSSQLGTSKMNMLGLGPAFFGHVMKKKHLSSLSELIGLAHDMGVRIVACQTAMEVMGITREELMDGLDFGGVATYLADARDSRITLFV
jgi:peroxiredoxin family protein